MTANVLRDSEIVPALRPLIERGFGGYLDEVRRILLAPFRVRGRKRDRVHAAALAATDFHVWQALGTLGDQDAAELGAGLIELAVNT